MQIRTEQEALYIACEMESTAVQLYTRALQVMKQLGREKEALYTGIEEMLKDEQGHLAHFRALYKGLDAEDEQRLSLAAVAEGILFDGGLMGAARRGLLKDVNSMIKLAADAERTSVKKYREFALAAQSEEAKQALLQIVAEEEGHLQELESALSASKRGFTMNKRITDLAYGGMMAALVFTATCFFKIPVSVTQGYIHLGDGLILLGAALLGTPAVAAAAIGSMLADLLGGYTMYILPTFLIKGAVALVAVRAFAKTRTLPLTLVWLVLAEAVMVLGYFLAEWLVLGYGLAAALGAVLPNIVQGISGVIICAVLLPLKKRIMK